MAFAARFLSRYSRQVYAGQSFLRSASARCFAREAGGAPPGYESDEMSKDNLNKCQKLVEEIFEKEQPIKLNPEDPAAVAHYAEVMKTIREKTNHLSLSEWVKYRIEQRTRHAPDMRSYFRALKDLMEEDGIVDDVEGANAVMMEALDTVENQLKKPLMRNDVTGMGLLDMEFYKIQEKFDFCEAYIPRREEELELQMAKTELKRLKKNAEEAWEAQDKLAELTGEELPQMVEGRPVTLGVRLL